MSTSSTSESCRGAEAADAAIPSAQPDTAVDGRRARRERGRRAVIDAMIDLVLERGTAPSADEVVERAGVSQASLFRYFSTLDELRHEAIGRYFERFDHLIAIAEIGEGSLGERIERFVDARDAFYGRTAPMARHARRMGVEFPELAQTLRHVRTTFADQVARHFGPELDRLAAPARDRRVAIVAAFTSFESWDQLDGLGSTHRRAAMGEGLTGLLGR